MYRGIFIVITGSILCAMACLEIQTAARRLREHQGATAAAHSIRQQQQHRIKTTRDIVNESFHATFSHLQTCNEKATMQGCTLMLHRSLSSSNESPSIPWWFHTLLRDTSTSNSVQEGVNAEWHFLTSTSSQPPIQMCAMEKISSKQWRRVFCKLQNSTDERHYCPPEYTIPDTTSKFVFLRDPLERFLSAFMDKCLKRRIEGHCEPTSVFDNHAIENNRLFFEAFVDSMPLHWNVHFFPQSLYCDGLYRRISSYDFIGKMDSSSFYNDLETLGNQFGERMQGAMQQVFRVGDAQANNNDRRNGVEQSASSHVLEFYTPKTLRQVLEYVSIDYVLLNLTIPEWAERMLLEQEESL